MSDRFKEIRIQYDEHTMLLGRVARMPNKHLEYDCFRVLCFIGGVQYDITNGFTDDQRSHFLQAFELELEMKYRDALITEACDANVNDWDAGPEVAS